MDERLRFVARLLDGEKMAVVCREFGISRKTGYEIFNRYKDQGLSELVHDRVINVTQCGRICIGRRKINFSTVFAGQLVGIREVADGVWLVSFMDYDLGFFDNHENRVEPVGQNPFAPEVLPMSSI
jgi:putative transposase